MYVKLDLGNGKNVYLSDPKIVTGEYKSESLWKKSHFIQIDNYIGYLENHSSITKANA
jgi:hypothetical protein